MNSLGCKSDAGELARAREKIWMGVWDPRCGNGEEEENIFLRELANYLNLFPNRRIVIPGDFNAKGKEIPV